MLHDDVEQILAEGERIRVQASHLRAEARQARKRADEANKRAMVRLARFQVVKEATARRVRRTQESQ